MSPPDCRASASDRRAPTAPPARARRGGLAASGTRLVAAAVVLLLGAAPARAGLVDDVDEVRQAADAGDVIAVDTGRSLSHTTLVPAPVAEVWAAFTDPAIIVQWMGVARAEIDLRVGGTLTTSYVDEPLGGPNTIQHEITSYEPERMLSLRVRRCPPALDLAMMRATWYVLRFEPVDAARTRVVGTGYGYGTGPQWDALYRHFEAGNEWTFDRLVKHSASGSGPERAEVERIAAIVEGRAHADADTAALASYRAHLAAAEASLRLHDVAAARQWLDAAPAGGRGWEWRHLDACTDQSLGRLVAHGGETVFGLRVGADGTRLLTAGFDGTARVWDAGALERDAGAPEHDAEPLAVLAGHTDGLWAAAFLDGGARVVTAAGDRTARLFDAASGELLGTLWEHDTPVSCTDVAPDGRTIAASAYRWVRDDVGERTGVEGLVRLFDAASGAALGTLVGGAKPISLVRFSPDGARLAAACWDATVVVWDVGALLARAGDASRTARADGSGHASRTPEASGPASRPADTEHAPALRLDMEQGELYSAVDALDWSPDAQRLAAGSKAGEVRLFDAATGEVLHVLTGHVGHLGGVAFHPGAAVLASGGEDGTVRLWDTSSGKPLAVLHGHTALVHGMAYAPDGSRLYTASADGTVRAWPGDPASAGGATMEHRSAYTLSFPASGTRVASSTYAGSVAVWDARSGERVAAFELGAPSVNVVAFDPAGTRLAVARLDGEALVIDAVSGAVTARLGRGATGASGIAFSPSGGHVAVTHYDDSVRLADAATGELVWSTPGSAGARNSLGGLAFLPDGAALAVPWLDGARLLDAATGGTLRALEGAGARVHSVSVTPDGATVLASTADGDVVAWDVAGAALLWSRRGHGAGAERVRVAPDGSRAVSVAHDVVVWDVAAGAPLLRLRPHPTDVYDAAFSPDGTRLVTLGTDDRIRVLDALAPRERAADIP